MRRTIPRTDLLIAFEASARLKSFTLAAEELSLSPSAICKQVASLENYLGILLFFRVKRRLALTESGKLYFAQVSDLLRQVEQDTLSLMAQRGMGGVIGIAALPTFTSRWLIPRLTEFQKDNPDIIIDLSGRTEPFVLSGSPFRASINVNPKSWSGTQADYLFSEQILPVCKPELIGEKRQLQINELIEYPLLHQSIRPYAWRDWFESAGLLDVNPMGGARYELISMLIEGAKAGLGMILAPRLFVLNELASGELICPYPHVISTQRSYYLIYPEHELESHPFQSFRKWLANKAKIFRNSMFENNSILRTNFNY